MINEGFGFSSAIDNGKKIGLINMGHDNPTDQLFWVDKHKQLPKTGEQRLMFAILEDAYEVAISSAGYGKFQADVVRKRVRERDAARAWIAERDTDWIFSFITVCESLGFNPDWIRKGIQRSYR